MAQYYSTCFILWSIMLMSCDNMDCEPDTYTSTFTENKEILIVYDSASMKTRYTIEDGENIVFQYAYYNGHCDGNGDDYYRLTLTFEVSQDSTSFSFQDDELLAADCFVHHESVWSNKFYPIMKGSIDGHLRIDNVWEIKGWVKFTYPLTYASERTILFDKDFVK